MQTLYKNSRQALKVRIVLWVSLGLCVAALYGGWVIFETYGTAPGDGGILRPLGERLAFGGFVAALGVAAALGMMLFAALYVLRLRRTGDAISVETLTPWGFGARRYHFTDSDFGDSAYHHGRYSVARSLDRPGRFLHITVNAPWLTLYVSGRFMPFLLDLQAETIDARALSTLAGKAVTAWRQDRR